MKTLLSVKIVNFILRRVYRENFILRRDLALSTVCTVSEDCIFRDTLHPVRMVHSEVHSVRNVHPRMTIDPVKTLHLLKMLY